VPKSKSFFSFRSLYYLDFQLLRMLDIGGEEDWVIWENKQTKEIMKPWKTDCSHNATSIAYSQQNELYVC
jgi:hypothetical protein